MQSQKAEQLMCIFAYVVNWKYPAAGDYEFNNFALIFSHFQYSISYAFFFLSFSSPSRTEYLSLFLSVSLCCSTRMGHAASKPDFSSSSDEGSGDSPRSSRIRRFGQRLRLHRPRLRRHCRSHGRRKKTSSGSHSAKLLSEEDFAGIARLRLVNVVLTSLRLFTLYE